MAVGRSDGVKGDGSVTVNAPTVAAVSATRIPCRRLRTASSRPSRSSTSAPRCWRGGWPRKMRAPAPTPSAAATSKPARSTTRGPASNRRRGCPRRKTRCRRCSNQPGPRRIVSERESLARQPTRYAEAKGGASAPVESGSRGFKISDPRSIIPTDLTRFCGI